MKKWLRRVLGAFVTIITFTPHLLSAQSTAFTYQGRLNDSGGAANGIYDLRFTIYDSTNLPGVVVAGPLTNSATVISNGLFTVALDFGPGVFTGPDRWLEIGVRTNGAGVFTALAARQRIAPTPYSIFSQNLSAGGLSSGTYGNAVAFNNGANSFNGTHSGNGVGLTNVNALTLGGVGANGFWRTTGNAGTAPGANFIGTTDNQPLEIQVNGTRALRIEPQGLSAASLVGGYYQNTVTGFFGAVVAGGGADSSVNSAAGNFAFVGAGYGNSAGYASAAVGGAYNRAPSTYSFLGSGAVNTNGSDYSFLGSGLFNWIDTNSPYSVIGGGANNVIRTNSQSSMIAGGHDNSIQSANFAFIGGGGLHVIQSGAFDSVIAGGGYGTIGTNAHSSFIGGGGSDTIGTNAVYSSIVGGQYNNNGSSYSAVGGGQYNVIEPLSDWSAIAGGGGNVIGTNSGFSAIAGGVNNAIRVSAQAAIAGGQNNVVSNAASSTIAGGHDSAIQSANFAFIGGGGLHVIQSGAFDSVIAGGGYGNIQTDSHSSFIGGGGFNTIQTNSPYSFIGGGQNNTIQFNSSYSTIAGGWANTIQTNATYSTIGGGVANVIQTNSIYSTIGGGLGNTIQSNALFATIPGGYLNTVAGIYGFAAGLQAQALHVGAFVWGDSQFAPFASTTNDQFSVRAQGGVRFVTSGAGMTLDGQPALTIGSSSLGFSILQNTSGAPNVVEGAPGNFIGAGVVGATIGGGGATNYLGVFKYSNSVTGSFGTVSGGVGNTAGGAGSFVGGGGSDGSSVSGNTATGAASVIGGGLGNTIIADRGVIGGGINNIIQFGADASTISGGSQNIVQSNASYAVIAGGIFNTNNSLGAMVGGGGNNNAGQQYSTVAGGYQNSVTGQFGVVSGGYQNKSTGSRATVPGGYLNLAAGDFSFAAGQQARALHAGSFVWADTQNAVFASTTSNQFNVRADNGLRVSDGFSGNMVLQPLSGAGSGYQALNFNGYYDGVTSTEQRFNTAKTRWRLVVDQRSAGDTMSIDSYNGSTIVTALTILTNGNVGVGLNNPTNKLQVNGDAAISGNLNFGAQTRQMLNLWGGVYGIGVQSYTTYFRTDNSFPGGGFAWYQGGVHNDNRTNSGGGITMMVLDNSGLRVNGTFVSVSDRNAKENFQPLSAREVLDKVAALPITRWNYKNDPSAPHLGPMAQDFYAAFNVGPDDKHIATVDESGVALAAIQGLNEKVEGSGQKSEARIQKLEAENAELKARLEKLERLISSKYAKAE